MTWYVVTLFGGIGVGVGLSMALGWLASIGEREAAAFEMQYHQGVKR